MLKLPTSTSSVVFPAMSQKSLDPNFSQKGRQTARVSIAKFDGVRRKYYLDIDKINCQNIVLSGVLAVTLHDRREIWDVSEHIKKKKVYKTDIC